jgi:hypothetical protein
MRAVDLIIIYFALGSPFGIHALTGDRRPIAAADLFRPLYRYLLWPLAAVISVTRWLIEDPSAGETAQRDRLVELREHIETSIFGGRCTPDVFAFRDLFERYAALTLSLGSEPYSHPQLALTGHTSKIAAACIYRRERARIQFHQQKARGEFNDFVRLYEADPRVLELSLNVAELLDDAETAQAISHLITPVARIPAAIHQPAP